MCRIIRGPPSLDTLFRPLHGHVPWDQLMYFRLRVLTLAVMWGRRHVANVHRYLEAAPHRTRFNNFVLVERWDPEAALRQKARALLRSLHPALGEPRYVSIDDSQHAKRGKSMDAVAKMKDPTTEASIRGHQSVCAILGSRDPVMPWGIRLYVKKTPCTAVGVPFQKTTEWAAQLIREFKAPPGVKVMVLFDASYRCHTVVKACRAQRFHCATTLKRHRCLFKHGWKLKAGRYGRNRCRRRRPATLDLTKPHGQVRSRVVEAGWLQVSTRGPLPVICSRKGTANKILGLVTDAPELSAADVIRTYDKRWTIEQWLKDVKPWLGLGQYQHRSY